MQDRISTSADTDTADIHAAIVPKFLEVALLASRYGESQTALAILNAVQGIRPDNAGVLYVRALAAIYSNRYAEAIDIASSDVLANRSDNALSKTILGMSHMRLGRVAEGQQLLTQVIVRNEDPQSVALAKALLEE